MASPRFPVQRSGPDPSRPQMRPRPDAAVPSPPAFRVPRFTAHDAVHFSQAQSALAQHNQQSTSSSHHQAFDQRQPLTQNFQRARPISHRTTMSEPAFLSSQAPFIPSPSSMSPSSPVSPNSLPRSLYAPQTSPYAASPFSSGSSSSYHDSPPSEPPLESLHGGYERGYAMEQPMEFDYGNTYESQGVDQTATYNALGMWQPEPMKQHHQPIRHHPRSPQRPQPSSVFTSFKSIPPSQYATLLDSNNATAPNPNASAIPQSRYARNTGIELENMQLSYPRTLSPHRQHFAQQQPVVKQEEDSPHTFAAPSPYYRGVTYADASTSLPSNGANDYGYGPTQQGRDVSSLYNTAQQSFVRPNYVQEQYVDPASVSPGSAPAQIHPLTHRDGSSAQRDTSMEHDGESDDDAEGEVDLPEDRTRQAHYRDDSRGGSEYDLRRRTTSGPTPSAQRPVRSSPRTTRYSPYSENTRNSSVPPPRRVRQTNVLPVPVPVPNLTKKSRGRHVPTELADAVDGDAGWRGARAYTCVVAGCGKCFARGEHLKRHVRSIHTYEKPHKCPFPGCGKEFSRHDNLGQHMRVHKNHSAPRDGLALHFDERAGGA